MGDLVERKLPDQRENTELPEVLGRYELLHEIASGGMATVYLARVAGAAGFERLVAVKRCHPHLRREPEFAAMFLDEARLAAGIHHPNVVGTLDVSPDDSASLYLVMEFVDGFSLWELLRVAMHRKEPMPTGVALRIAVDTLAGLHAAHELRDADGKTLNLVHRDVSPQNVLVGADGIARIMDFGIAKAESRMSVTRDGCIKGKLAYMPPEQHGLLADYASHPVTRRADVFAMGVLLWETLTGARLFSGDTETKTVRRVVAGVVRAPSAVRPGLPSALDEIVLRALEKDPDARYATAAEFAEAIESAGVPLASARAVADHVRHALGTAIARRETLLRSLRARPSGAGSTSGTTRVPAIISAAATAGLPALREAPTAAGAHSLAAPTGSGHGLSRGTRGRVLAVGLLAVALAVAAAALGLAGRSGEPGGANPPPARAALAQDSGSLALANPPPRSTPRGGDDDAPVRAEVSPATPPDPRPAPGSTSMPGAAPQPSRALPAHRTRSTHAPRRGLYRPEFL